MTRARLALVLFLALTVVSSGCALQVGAKKATPISVGALMWPGGGASPQVLSLYKGALEVTRASDQEYALAITEITPDMSAMKGGMEPPKEAPELTAMRQALEGNNPPDIVLFNSPYEFSGALDSGLLLSLDAYTRNDKSLKVEDYFPGALQTASSGGELYGVPISVSPTVLMYDKRVFAKAGVPEPKGEWDWPALVETAKRLTAGGASAPVQAALNLDPTILFILIWQNGGDILSADGKHSALNTPEVAEAVKFFSDLIHTYKVMPEPPKPDEAASIKEGIMRSEGQISPGEVPPIMGPNGPVAMQLQSYWGEGAWPMYGFQPGVENPFHLVAMPRGRTPATMMQVQTILAVNKKSANPRLAYKALARLADEMQKGSGFGIQANRVAAQAAAKTMAGMSPEDMDVILRALDNGRALPSVRQNDVMQIVWERLVSPIQQGEKPPAEVAREASDALEKVLRTPPGQAGNEPLPVEPQSAPAPSPIIEVGG